MARQFGEPTRSNLVVTESLSLSLSLRVTVHRFLCPVDALQSSWLFGHLFDLTLVKLRRVIRPHFGLARGTRAAPAQLNGAD